MKECDVCGHIVCGAPFRDNQNPNLYAVCPHCLKGFTKEEHLNLRGEYEDKP